jgi:hypothetical protein
MCVECWADKRGRDRAPFFLPKTRGGDPGDAEWLGSGAWWAVGVVCSALVGLFFYAVTS